MKHNLSHFAVWGRTVFCKLVCCFFVILTLQVQDGWSQCGTGTSTVYTVNFSAAKDTSWTLTASRAGTACVGTSGADDRCIRFNITVNPGTDLINFATQKITGASFYSINCGPLIPIGTPACVTGLTTVCISFCKPGNDPDDYIITASSIIKGSGDIILRQNCSGTMSVTGVSAASVSWRSVFPGAGGTYNSYLSATSGVTSVTVTPQTGAPQFIDYEVSGTGACPGLRRDTIRVYTVAPMVVNINPINPAICNGASVALNGSVTGGNPPYTYSWNTGQSSTGITVSTPAAYTLTVSDNTVGCPAVQQVANVVAAPTPAAPTAAGVTICSGTSATLNATAPGGTYQWYDAPTGGNLLATNSSYTTPTLTANTTYYVQTTVNGCTSSRTAVTVTITSIPAAPTASGATICAGGTTALLATAPGTTFQWYDAGSGGNLLASTASYTTPALNTNTTYYVQAINGSCSGPRSAVAVVVNPIPASPTAAGVAICSGNTGSLLATAPGGTYQWYDAAAAGNLLISNPSFTSPTLTSNTTYYVQTTVNGCTSVGRTPVTITVNPTPALPTIDGAAICGGNSTGLSVTSPVAGEVYRWYNQSVGGDLLQISNSFTTPVLNTTTSYFVSATSAAGCTSSRATVTVNVTPIQNPAFVYSAGTYCVSGGINPTPTIPGGNIGTFSATPAGLVFLDNTTGQINVAASTPNVYTITFTTGGACVYSSSVNIRITNVDADARFSYSGPFCVNQSNPLPVFLPSSSAGSFTSSSPNLLFKNSSSGEIDLINSLPGTYTVTNTIAGVTGCVGAVETAPVEIKTATTANAGTSLVACEGQPVLLNGTVGGSATAGSWSINSGSGSFSNASQLSTTFTPSVGQNSVILRLTSNNPVAPCAVASDLLVIEVKPTPSLPTISAPSVCSGTTATLLATAPGGVYNWYTSSSGGLLGSGASFLTPVLTNDITYFVSVTSLDGCTSARQPVTVTVKPLPIVNSPTTGETCSGINQNYSITSSILGSTFSWSRPAVVNIDNPVVSGVSGSSITESLTSIVTTAVSVVYQIIPTANGCTGPAFNYTVTVKPIPVTPVASTTAVCEGEIIRLSTPERAGAFYNWTGPDGFISNLRLPEIPNALKATKEGTYFVRVVENGCQSLPGSVVQTVKAKPAAPVVGNSSPVCIGESFSLNTPIVIGASYAWTGPNGFSSTDQQPSITNAQSVNAGNYSLSISVDGCSSNPSSTNVAVNAPPGQVDVSSTGPVCIAEELRLIAQELPSATYFWTGPNGFEANSRVAIIASMNNATAGAYQVVASVAGCASIVNSIDASLKPTPAAPIIDPVSSVCENETLILNVSPVSGASYNWTGPAGFISNTQSPAITNISIAASGNYAVNVIVNGCRSANSTVNITVNPLPTSPQISNNGAVCVGNNLQLNAIAVTGATYQWTGPGGFTSVAQNPLITNAQMANAGIYTAALVVNGCRGPSSSTTAIVNPLPGPVNIQTSGPACEGRSLSLTADSVTAGSYSWTGPNGFSATTRSILLASMNSGNSGNYQVVVSVAGCVGVNNSINTILKPTPAAPVITVASPVCQNSRLNLGANMVTGATYYWTGPNGFESRLPSPFIDSIKLNQSGIYSVNITVDGCVSNNRSVNIAVVPEPSKPLINSNSPVCFSDPLQLTATAGVNANFRWIGNNGFASIQQNPRIASANYTDSGRYGAFVLINGCVSDTAYTTIKVDQPASANAGNDQVVCANNAVVQLSGIVNGGTATGIWTSNGTGSFLRSSTLNTSYFPSSADTALGVVRLTLTSTNNGACRAAASSLLVTITDAPRVNAGANRLLCNNDSLVTMNGSVQIAGGGIWSTTGSGTFVPSNTDLNAIYRPSATDLRSANFRITLTSTNNGNCLAVQDQRIIQLVDTPKVDLGKDLFVFENTPIRINPTISGNAAAFSWTPPQNLNDANTRSPVFRGMDDQTLVLRVTSAAGCVGSDNVFITVVKPFKIPNVFSPNGDGIHDTWVIPELEKYPDAIVHVFDRYGRRIFFTEGYKKPWNGTHNDKPVAVATYYYIIEPKLIPGIFSGSVTIIR